MTAKQILIVEDEPKIAQLVKEYLESSGYRTFVIDNGLDVIDWVRRNNPDLMLLDLMLPGRDGLEICEELRSFSDLPVIMVTARIEEIDRLLGLDLGADDYICKPFSPRELVSRVKAVLRRFSRGDSASDIKLLELDEGSYKVGAQGKVTELTSIEFQLLKTLMNQPGRIFPRQLLMDQIYADYRVVSERTIDSHIKKLRRKLITLLPEFTVIHSVYAVGYKYEVQPNSDANE